MSQSGPNGNLHMMTLWLGMMQDVQESSMVALLIPSYLSSSSSFFSSFHSLFLSSSILFVLSSAHHVHKATPLHKPAHRDQVALPLCSPSLLLLFISPPSHLCLLPSPSSFLLRLYLSPSSFGTIQHVIAS